MTPPTKRDDSRRRAALRDLTWKDGLDAFTCTECGRCKDACPTFLTGKPLSLKWVNDSLKHHLVEQREAILPRATRSRGAAGARARVIGEDTLWACTTCGYCEAACPIELEHLPQVLSLRQQRVMMEGAFPHELKRRLRRLRSRRAIRGACPPTRAATGRNGLGVPCCATPAARAGARLAVLRGVGRVLRRARTEDRPRLRAGPPQAGVKFAILGAARPRPASASAAPATRCCSSSCRDAARDHSPSSASRAS